MATCANCGTAIPEGSETVLQGKDKNIITICSNCAAAIERAIQAETEDPNLVGALLLGLGAALVSSLLWYAIVVITKYELGIVAIAVGWLVAQAVILGAGRKRGVPLQMLSVFITVMAMAFSEYLIVRHFAVEALAKKGYTDIPYLLPLNMMFTLIVEGIKSDPLTLVFWGIAVWEAFALPAQRKLRLASTRSTSG